MKKLRLSIIMGLFTLAQAGDKPNFILINMDDQGYADLSCFGEKTIHTPHIDQMASEGRRLTDFLNASSICTPSRAALMTGSYPKRMSMHHGVIFPKNNFGLHPDEVTIADVLQSNGYATSCVGKWHLGHTQELVPTSQGFDYYYGIPFSNDMNHPNSEVKKPKTSLGNQKLWWADPESTFTVWDTPLYENDKVIERPVDQRLITKKFTDKTIERAQLAQQKNEPFFIYLAHSMPHLPLYVPDELWEEDFKKSYEIVTKHIDAEIGRLMAFLKESGLDENTYVIYTSDNGPSFKQYGSASPLKGNKFSTHEGGFRVPCIVWAPGRVPAASQYDELVTTMDLLPTLAALSGSELDPTIKIDGHDVSKQLVNDEPTPTKEFLYYSSRGTICSIRQGDYKLRYVKQPDGSLKKSALYNLKEDVSEKRNLINEKSELADTLVKRMLELDQEIATQQRPRWNGEQK